MITFKLCNEGKSVVATREDGAMVSYSIEAEEYKQWLLDGGVPEPEFTALELAQQVDVEAKVAKVLALETLTVTTSLGTVFDGNETARVNMLSAINTAIRKGLTETNWKLADNSQKIITLSELQEAHDLAIYRVGELVLA